MREAPLRGNACPTATDIAKLMATVVGRDHLPIPRDVADIDVDYYGNLTGQSGRVRNALDCRCLFGNDGYLLNPRSQREVQLLRQALGERGIEELGFGWCPDGHTWAMLVYDPQNKLSEELRALLWDAWFRASDLDVGLAQQTNLPEPQRQGDETDAR